MSELAAVKSLLAEAEGLLAKGTSPERRQAVIKMKQASDRLATAVTMLSKKV